jgi:FkbM family methyltransferase
MLGLSNADTAGKSRLFVLAYESSRRGRWWGERFMAGPRLRAMDARETVRGLMVRAGLGRALEWGAYNWPSRTMRRDRRDNRHAIVAMAAHLELDSNCVDVGAHRGAFLAHMSRLAPQGRHVACEPLPHLAAELRTAFPDVAVHEVALADEEGEATFHFLPTMQGFSGLHDVAPGEHEVKKLQVRTARLDDLLDPELPIALIKIDVEGAELGVLDGAERTLKRHRPAILLEHGVSAASFGTTSADVHERLAAAGLRMYDMDGDGPLSAQDVTARIRDGKRWNWLAR